MRQHGFIGDLFPDLFPPRSLLCYGNGAGGPIVTDSFPRRLPLPSDLPRILSSIGAFICCPTEILTRSLSLVCNRRRSCISTVSPALSIASIAGYNCLGMPGQVCSGVPRFIVVCSSYPLSPLLASMLLPLFLLFLVPTRPISRVLLSFLARLALPVLAKASWSLLYDNS